MKQKSYTMCIILSWDVVDVEQTVFLSYFIQKAKMNVFDFFSRILLKSLIYLIPNLCFLILYFYYISKSPLKSSSIWSYILQITI